MNRQHWRPDVQGLRAVAVIGVLAFHAGVGVFRGGFVGVDVFFVISGFLITTNLLRERDDSGRIALRRFFAGRLVRLAPAALATVTVTLVAAWTVLPPLDRVGLRTEAWAATLGLENILLARTGTDYLADHTPGLFQQFWSLGVEEQFYLGWATLLAAVCAVPALRRRLWLPIVVLCTASFVVMFLQSAASGPWAFFGIHARAWELGAGAFVAALVHQRGRSRRAPRAVERLRGLRRWSGLAGLAVIVGSFVAFDSTTPFPGIATVVPVIGAVLIVAPGVESDPARRLLRARAMTWVGDRSYSLYLWHWPALVLPAAALGRSLEPWETGAALGVTVTFGWASHRFLERASARWFRSRRRGPLVLVGAAAVAGALVVPLTTIPDLRSTRPAETAEAARVLDGPTAPDSVPSNVTPTILGADDDLPIVYANGCHADPTATESATGACVLGDRRSDGPVVLLGDSHAAQWTSPLRAVAGGAGRQLVVLTKSACPAVDLSIESVELGRTYHECATWRADSMERIEALHPSLVVVANASAGYRALIETDDFTRDWGAGLRRQLDEIRRRADAPVAVLQDTPRWNSAPNRCLSASPDHVARCALPADELIAPDIRAAEQAAAGRSGATVIDPLPWVCTRTCSPVLWNVLAYRDSNHITDELASALAPRLHSALQRVLAPPTP
ncbi:MAG: acyltransferase family protein [Curtobacterium sp.]